MYPNYQSKGFGSHVSRKLLEQNEVKGKRVTLNVLQGSSAKRIYERFGFKVESENLIDVYMSVNVEGNIRTVEGM